LEIRGRVEKLLLYVRAGIPGFWRLELDHGVVTEALRLVAGVYVSDALAGPGRFQAERPFPVAFGPAQVLA
jgi:hypothetical protein